MSETDVFRGLDEAPTTRAHWRWTVLAASCDYFDAGSIVAGAVALTMWASQFSLTSTTVGLIGAFSSNGISTGVGALVGGWLGDRYGRRNIYAWDLLLFIVGVAVIIFSVSAPMLIAGYVLTGLAVGADIPNSISLLAEFAPRNRRSRLIGLAPVMWLLGPLVVLALAVGLHSLGLLGAKIIFAHLAAVALVVWFLRRKMTESPRWAHLQGQRDAVDAAVTEFGGGAATGHTPRATQEPTRRGFLGGTFVREALPGFAFLAPLIAVWNIPAGTYGFFYPYLLHTAGGRSTFAANYLDMLNFGLGIITLVVFMRIGDRLNRRREFVIFGAVSALSFFLFLFLPISNIGTVLGNIVLFQVGGNALFHFWRLWSAELFPTRVRAVGMGMTLAVAHIVVGVWSIFLPMVTAALGFSTVALMLALMEVFVLVWGGLFGMSTQGQPLEGIRFSFRTGLRGSVPGQRRSDAYSARQSS